VHKGPPALPPPTPTPTLPLQVNIQSIVIKGPSDGTGPKRVKLFVNRMSMGFSDAGECPRGKSRGE
jgi:hypothetical protein